MEQNHEIIMYGRYGEEIRFSETGEGGYNVSCKEIGMDTRHMSKQEFDDFAKRYVVEGVRNFEKSDMKTIKSRAVNMGRWIRRCYIFLKNPSQEEVLVNSAWIYQTMVDAMALGLTEEQYVKWFILQDYQTGPERLSNKDRDYLETLLSLKRRVVDPYNRH